ncbi:MAG: glutathione S-transferase family protein [Bdellovibrionales bacterium]
MAVHIYCMGLQDRSDRVRWLLEELQVPYENHFLSRKKGELNTDEYRALNPMGRVPTIRDQDLVLHESVGICLHLADRYQAHQKLAPEINSHERALYYQWMVFSVGSLEAVVARMFTFQGKSENEINQIKQQVQEQCEIFKKVLNPILSKQEYILPSGFSAADIMLSAVIPGAWDYLVKNNPPIEKYMDRLMSRPCAVKAKVFETPDMTNA